MKVLSVIKIIEYIVETDDPEYPTYRRGENGGWENSMGNSWEEAYFPDEIEKAYQEYIYSRFRSKKRPVWNQVWMEIANIVSKRSTCLRRKVGAVLVSKDNFIISTGYNGAPTGEKHCETCVREENNIPSGERHELCRAVHAEQNCIIQAARRGVSTVDAVLYCTTKPCIICEKMLKNAGIKIAAWGEDYPTTQF